MTNFKLDNSASIDNTSLAGVLDESQKLIVESFDAGPGFPMETDKGYDDESWTFVVDGDESKVFNCYRRWGVMRVGCHMHSRHLVDEFKTWLKRAA